MRRRYLKAVKNVINNYLTIEALEDELTVSLTYSTCLYCIDGNNKWKLLDTGKSITINKGQTISFKDALYNNFIGCGNFVVNKKFNLVGNVMSMLFGDNAKNIFDLSNYSNAFINLFNNCSTLQSVSSDFLPATILSESCYSGMFQGCTSLTEAPELPATILASYCYSYMFGDCTSLVTAPALPATSLAQSCYQKMFLNCTKLNYIKALFTTTSTTANTSNWVNGVSSTGTFVKSKDATWNVTGNNGIPNGWTVITV